MRKFTAGFWLPSVVKRINLFLFLEILMMTLLYILGNFQGFLDSTQILILEIFKTGSIIFIISACYQLILIVVSAFIKRKFDIAAFFLSIIGAAVVAALLLLSEFIVTWI